MPLASLEIAPLVVHNVLLVIKQQAIALLVMLRFSGFLVREIAPARTVISRTTVANAPVSKACSVQPLHKSKVLLQRSQ
jgi:hypothetical protein